MRAVLLGVPGPTDALHVRELPIPTPRAGRAYDGGYAGYTCVPVRQVVPFTSSLDWSMLGTAPEMLQTSHGSLMIGLDARPGDQCAREDQRLLRCLATGELAGDSSNETSNGPLGTG
jgi:NADPH:quinone reductase-like Zn-dependent oxidoreductase